MSRKICFCDHYQKDHPYGMLPDGKINDQCTVSGCGCSFFVEMVPEPKKLRDEFAMAALPTAWRLVHGIAVDGKLVPQDTARLCYVIADAMMVEREK